MEGWKYYFIEDFGTISTGTTPSTKRPEFYGGQYKFISPVDLDKGKYINTSHKLLTEEGLKAGRTLPKNAILVGCIGNIGKIGMTADVISSFNQQINAIVCNESFDPDFIYYLLTFHRPLLEKSAVKTTLPILNKGNFQKIKIQAPEFPEQRKIAYVLSTIQKAIEQQDKLIKTTTELKKALMQKLFTEGLYGEKQKETEIGLVPESWEVVKLSEICEKPQYGFTDSASSTGNAKFLRITDITKFGVNWDAVPFCNCPDIEKYKLIKGDIVFARIGATTGKSYIIENPPKSVFASYLIRVRCKNNILPGFLIYYFKTGMYWNQINSRKGDNLKGGVNGSVLSRLIVSKPTLEEQKEIAKILETLDKKIEFHQKKKQTLTDLFKTMLHELMTGQRRVNEIDFENEKEELLPALSRVEGKAAEPEIKYKK